MTGHRSVILVGFRHREPTRLGASDLVGREIAPNQLPVFVSVPDTPDSSRCRSTESS
jgi:hypothetical protein